MATVYSLICFGGRTGKTVTLTIASPCVLTSTNHGLRDGTGLRFKSNGDTLPTGLTAGVTYYAKSTAANTVNLYSDAALTTIVNTSGTQSGTHILQSLLVADPANALAPYGLSDLSRYGSSGSERVYDGIASWSTGRAAALNIDSEVGEIGEAFTETRSSTLTLNIPSATFKAITTVNGVRSAAFHGGVIWASGAEVGFIFRTTVNAVTAIVLSGYGNSLDGFTVLGDSTSISNLTNINGVQSGVRNMVYTFTTTQAGGNGVYLSNSLAFCENTVVVGVYRAFNYSNTYYGVRFAFNIASKCTIGFGSLGTSNQYGFFYNNIALGNTKNWETKPTTAIEGASNNAGLSTDTPWTAGTGATSIAMTTADFADFANNDFRPALSTSPQVDSALAYYGYDTQPFDNSGDERPNYNNGGAEAYDIGAYEFDHGYGPHPASHTLTLTNVVVGSRILIRDAADTVSHYSADAAASTVVITVTVYSDARDNWVIRVRKGTDAPFYQPYRTEMTATAGASSIYVDQIPD